VLSVDEKSQILHAGQLSSQEAANVASAERILSIVMDYYRLKKRVFRVLVAEKLDAQGKVVGGDASPPHPRGRY
jgi:hypothetical protein